MRSDDARNWRKPFVSVYLLSCIFYFHSRRFTLALSDLLYLPFSLPGAGDQSVPVPSLAAAPSPSVPDTFGPSAPRADHHRGREREAGQGAQRGGGLKQGQMIKGKDPLLSHQRTFERDLSLTLLILRLIRSPGTVTVCGLS